MKFLSSLFIAFFLSLTMYSSASSQLPVFTHQDTLRGSITKEREWWDLTYYHLNIKVNPAEKSIAGTNTIEYRVLKPLQVMQIDLQNPMEITKVVQDEQKLQFNRHGNAYFVNLIKTQKTGDINTLTVFYRGKPKISRRPPWDGGLTWSKDRDGNDFIATTCQGDGASLWWPCKDHLYDEPDSMLISVTVPEKLFEVSNGRLKSININGDGTKTFHWFVSNPINNYNVNVNIGNYVNFTEKYHGENGVLDCSYYVLRYNLEKARKQFKEVPRMLKAFEYWFGPYPFYKDSYKLVEVPYTGMEHQSSVTYGNGYKNGYMGNDVSHTGWGMKFDFIIVHESGHEWFGNSITDRDIADMWIHESFIAYSENLFLNYYYGKKASAEYVLGTRQNIRNDRPIIGIYNVNYEGSGDMYYKGANMLHTLRQIVDDDNKWRSILRGLNKKFYHQTVTSAQIENYLTKHTGINLAPFFNQYLRDVRIPVLEYIISDSTFQYRWNNCVKNFNMPVKVCFNEKVQWIHPTVRWQTLKTPVTVEKFILDPNFYAASFNLRGNADNCKF
ncbi:M1 family peptidase [candidate division KSB1 bacterium]|nr:MAG: M1 family peptidase [candidate division KSB1 bacterium]